MLTLQPEASTRGAELLEFADKALYHAKHAARTRVQHALQGSPRDLRPNPLKQ